MRFFIKAVLAAWCAMLATSAVAAGIWFSAGDSLYRVDPASGQALLVANPGTTQALAVDPKDGSVWALVSNRALKLGESGNVLAEFDLKGIGFENATGLSLNPYTSTLWLGDGKALAQVGTAGNLIAMSQVPGVVRPLALGVDEDVWVLGNKQLWRYSPQGALLSSHDISAQAKDSTKLLAVDSVNTALWVAGERELLQLRLPSLAQVAPNITIAQTVVDLALDPKRGVAWVLTQDAISAYGKDGSALRTIDVRPLAVTAAALSFDAATDGLWLAHGSGLIRFTSDGAIAATIATNAAVSTLGVAPFTIAPVVSILKPPQNALTNSPRPEFSVAYDALCSDVSCGFPPSYFGSYSLNALLNNEPVGPLFAFDAATGQASFTPAMRLPEGSNVFTAQARDNLGHLSATATNTFTVDTIAPRFLGIVPAEGATFSNPNINIQGTIDDAGAVVTLLGTGMTSVGASFSFPVVLQPGLNTFSLSATDAAGNATTAGLHLTLSSLSITLSSPASGSTVNADRVTVSGTFQGPNNTGVTVNGIVASVSGNTFVAPNVPLAPGANTLTATATTSNGQTGTATLSVTSTGPAPIQVNASASQGIAPLAVTFALSNSTANSISSIQADFEGTGSFTNVTPGAPMAWTYSAPRTYPARFIVTDSSGAVFDQTLTIVATDPAAIDQMLRAVWSGFASALLSRDIPQALQYFNAPAQAKYLPVLNALSADLPQIVASFSPLLKSDLAARLSEYAIVREDNGRKNVYFIHFLQGADGIWRLDSM